MAKPHPHSPATALPPFERTCQVQKTREEKKIERETTKEVL